MNSWHYYVPEHINKHLEEEKNLRIDTIKLFSVSDVQNVEFEAESNKNLPRKTPSIAPLRKYFQPTLLENS